MLTLEKEIAQNAEPENKIVFIVEGSNWTCQVEWEDLYSQFDFDELLDDVCTKVINYLFLNRSNLELKVTNLDDKPPKLGILLLVKIQGKTKEFIVPTWKILKQSSCPELSNKYLKKLNEVLALEES